jgi:hypothetical protein
MVKIAAITGAALLILWVVSLVIAYKAGKKARELSSEGVEESLYRDMARYINNVVNGTSLDSDFWASLSPKTLEQGEKLVARFKSIVNR